MKKWLVLFTVLYCISLCGCGNKNAGDEVPSDSTGDSLSAEYEETTLYLDNEPTKDAVGEPENNTTKETSGKQENANDADPTQPAHTHTLGSWKVTEAATCDKEGEEKRVCTKCNFSETRSIAKKAHTYSAGSNLCSVCMTLKFDANAAVVELGNIAKYEAGNTANYVWDVKIFDGKVFRGAGDYDQNSGDTTFMAFDIQNSQWLDMGTATDEAIHRFTEINGKLYTPGIDSRDGGWELGNFYVLENDAWKKVRNVPNGIHCFDMIGFGGKIYLGVATQTVTDTVAVSSDNGQSWSYLPLAAADGSAFATSNYEWSRTYAFVEYNGTFYALLQFKIKGQTAYDMEVFRYADGKMVYVAKSTLHDKVGRNYWQSAFEWKGKCYITAKKGLWSIGDFANTGSTTKAYKLQTGKEIVTDAILYKDEMYVLSYLANSDGSYKTVIFKTSTGEANSFTQVASFDYEGIPYSFDFDGSHFYVGIGAGSKNDASKAGMLLRVKPN